MHEIKLKILLLEDNENDVELLQYELKKAKMEFFISVVDLKEDYIYELKNFNPDIILSDHSLPAFNSMVALSIRNNYNPNIPFILVTGTISEEFAVECMKAGADDYILKSSLKRLPSAINNALSKEKIKKEKSVIEALHYELQSAFAKIEQQNKEILSSISYAKRLQDSIFPKEEYINGLIKDYFILFKPRDIVSGDFYFVEPIELQFKDRLVAIAVADCTGHGVPGAFISILGYEILKNALLDRNVFSASEILNYLNDKLAKILTTDSVNQQLRDGMDIAFCIFDKKTLKLYYSGANNPCLIIKKNKAIIELFPDKQPIGFSETINTFSLKIVQLEKEDMVYLFTDGFADQFGGPLGKKLKKNFFRQKLVEISAMPLSEQKIAMENTFNNWKAELEQVDDVLLLGFRV